MENNKKKKESVKVYNDWLEEGVVEDKLLLIEAWARNGVPNKDIASNLGISEPTFYKLKKVHKDVDKALKSGKEVLDVKVENALIKKAIGYTVTDVKTKTKVLTNGDIETETTEIKKHIAGDTGAIIFFLKNRMPKVWRDRKDQDVNLSTADKLTEYFNILDGQLEDDEQGDVKEDVENKE